MSTHSFMGVAVILKRVQGTEQRRLQILEAAGRVFARKGYERSTTAEIAREAGVAEGTIFRYFETKKALLVNLMAFVIMESLTSLLKRIENKTTEEILKEILRNRLELIRENAPLFKLFFAESLFQEELRDKFIEEVVLRATATGEAFFREQQKQGNLRPVNPQIAFRCLMGMLGIFVVWSEFLGGDKYVRFDDEEVLDTIISIYLDGVRSHGR
ncbi:MAG: TetR/AcrR family transcriptional regulator [Bacillota bacterium]